MGEQPLQTVLNQYGTKFVDQRSVLQDNRSVQQTNVTQDNRSVEQKILNHHRLAVNQVAATRQGGAAEAAVVPLVRPERLSNRSQKSTSLVKMNPSRKNVQPWQSKTRKKKKIVRTLLQMLRSLFQIEPAKQNERWRSRKKHQIKT